MLPWSEALHFGPWDQDGVRQNAHCLRNASWENGGGWNITCSQMVTKHKEQASPTWMFPSSFLLRPHGSCSSGLHREAKQEEAAPPEAWYNGEGQESPDVYNSDRMEGGWMEGTREGNQLHSVMEWRCKLLAAPHGTYRLLAASHGWEEIDIIKPRRNIPPVL